VRRLATQIHLTIVGVLALFALLAGAAWVHGPAMRQQERLAEGLAVAVGELLPPAGARAGDQQAALDLWARRFRVDAALLAPDGTRLASSGAPLALPRREFVRSHVVRLRGGALSLVLRLPDGRLLVAAHPKPDVAHLGAVAVTLALLASTVALGAWPLVARLTRRLERLRRRVEDLGGGDLAARAPVEGRDEIGDLARSFNRAADRIQALVEAQRHQLAFASHELRSPLARLRVSLELLAGDPAVKASAARDVAELDGLIDELLEASRLQAQPRPGRLEDVDLLALVAEEAARFDAEVEGEPVVLRGDPRLLRRLVRNLLDNARRHAGGTAVEARVAGLPSGGARLLVMDRGPGIHEAERERVFEPFHRPTGRPETGAGYGLGLALVRQIARAHGGEARCLGREGGGTVLEVDLPGVS
jgi:signal transduction histidine kinase